MSVIIINRALFFTSWRRAAAPIYKLYISVHWSMFHLPVLQQLRISIFMFTEVKKKDY